MPRTNPQLSLRTTFQGASIPLPELTDLLSTAQDTFAPDTANVSFSTSRPDRPGESTISTITIDGSPANKHTTGTVSAVPR